MKSRSCIRLAAAIVAVLVLSIVSGGAWAEDGRVPDPSAMAMLLPETAKAPAPAWAKPGTTALRECW